MTYLIAELWMLLLAAGGIGLLAGWLIFGRRG